MRHVVIYRHELFKSSEKFISQQKKYLTQFQPILVGRTLQGEPPDPQAAVVTIEPSGLLALGRQILFRNNDSLLKQLPTNQPALIHAYCGIEGVYALPLAKKLSTPLITTFYGFDTLRTHKALLASKKISWFNYLLHRRRLAKQGNLFIAVSHFVRQRMIKLGFPEDRTLTHYTGVDTETIVPTTTKKSEKIILHVAKLVDAKGTRYLLEALSILRKQSVEARLIIIGDGPLLTALREYSTTLGIASYVTFLGKQPHHHVIAWMQQASVFCLPSIETYSGETESLSMVLMEAAACQLPAIATLHGGIPEIVNDGKTGLLVPERHAKTLADRLSYLLTNDSIAEKMGLAARKHVIENFNLKTQTEILESIYSNLLANADKVHSCLSSP